MVPSSSQLSHSQQANLRNALLGAAFSEQPDSAIGTIAKQFHLQGRSHSAVCAWLTMAANAALRSQEISTDHCLTLKLMAHRVNNDGLRYSNQRVGDLVALIRAESGASAEQVRAAFDRFQSFIISGHVESSSNSHAATTKRERLTDEERIIVRQKRLEALVTGNESGGLSMAALAKRFAVSEYQIAATQAWLTIAPMRALPKALRGQPLPLHDVIGEIQKAVFTAFTAGKEQVDGRTACGIANRFGLMRDQDKIVEACARLFEMIK